MGQITGTCERRDDPALTAEALDAGKMVWEAWIDRWDRFENGIPSEGSVAELLLSIHAAMNRPHDAEFLLSLVSAIESGKRPTLAR